MALWKEYKCCHCGYEISASEEHNDALMSGYYGQYKCARCNEIVNVHYGFSPPLPFIGQCDSEASDPEFGVLLPGGIRSHIRCNKCKRITVLTPWKPALGCPKCGRKLEETGGMILAD